MPYRRLPNTDSARIRSLQSIVKQGGMLPINSMAISHPLLLKITSFLPLFKQNVDYQNESFRRQSQNSKTYLEVQKRAKLYISHYIQVVNLAIIRGELKPEIRKYYGLEEDQKTVPALNTESDIITWGERIIKGESERLLTGASPITNPTIAVVKVRYEDFTRTFRNQKNLQEIFAKACTKVATLRQEADELILEAWNQIEQHFSNLPQEEMRKNAALYGVTYVYRKNEKDNEDDDNNLNQNDLEPKSDLFNSI